MLRERPLIQKKLHHHYRNIIFDLGAVLVYFNAREILTDVFKAEPVVPYEILPMFYDTEFLDLDRGLKTVEEVAETLSSKYNKIHVTRFLHAVPHYLVPLEQGQKLFDSIRDLGYKTYILSNLSSACYAAVERYDFFKKCDGAVLSFQAQAAKPDRAIYNHLLTKYNLLAHECLFIDDFLPNIEGAKNVGIDGIVLKNHTQVVEHLQKIKVL